MKILVFSDSHLYLPFEEKKFLLLKRIIASSDRVVIDGDFFDSYMVSFDQFVNSPWNRLFPLLKARKTIYIYGNHDQRSASDRRADLFSDIQAERYKIKTKDKIYVFEHGQKIRVTADISFKIDRKILHFILKFAHAIRNVLVAIFGKAFITFRFAYRNKASKKRINDLYKPKDNEIYIIGHNHYAEVDEKNHFAASGMILYGFAQYLTIDNDKINIHEEWYR